MEAITQLVTDSLARHGFDRPVDPRRLQWSRWSRCDSPHSLLVVPSKPGIFALAEEIMDLGVGTDREGHDFSSEPALSKRSAPKGAVTPAKNSPASAAEGTPAKRLLAVLQFSEDDDMAFTLDRMFTRINPMRARLASGKCFLRFVVIEDQGQRRSICTALNQWILNSAEKATGIVSDFASSLELSVARTCPEMQSKGPSPANADSIAKSAQDAPPKSGSFSAALNSGAAKNLHCPHPLPSGF
jgi:hypothetical protein